MGYASLAIHIQGTGRIGLCAEFSRYLRSTGAAADWRKVFAVCPARDLRMALVQLPQFWFERVRKEECGNPPEAIACLRPVLMKPEHASWLDGKWGGTAEASSEVVGL